MSEVSFDKIIDTYYEGLYRFAFSLSRNEYEASDLTQQTFLIWARKGNQLRDESKVKTWLFTTLYREYLGQKRKNNRIQFMETEVLEDESNAIQPASGEGLDASVVMQLIGELEEPYRSPLVLFYIDQHSYKEIADILSIPIGTVMSRLSRAKSQLRHMMDNPAHDSKKPNIIHLENQGNPSPRTGNE